MHEDHRKRVRERFLKGGLDSFPAHNVLEMLLFYAIARQDTNETAHRLMNQFGSLTGVLDAPYEELCKVKGVGENSAALIMFASQLAKRYLAEQATEKTSFANATALHQYTVSLFTGLKTEVAFMLCLNNALQLLHCSQISLGTRHTMSLDNRTLLETAFRHNATKVILAHNHPCGIATPSSDDANFTSSAIKLFSDVQIQLLDHLIVAGAECFSMRNHPSFSRIFFDNVVPLRQNKAADSS